MTVYFVRRTNESNGPIKIGFTRSLKERVETLNRVVPGGVTLVASCDGGSTLERWLHAKLAEYRLEGEWFEPSYPVRQIVERAKNGGFSEASDPLTRDRVLPEDEFSDDIRVEARFYLNELLKREWRGYGDSVEAARNRVMDRLGVHRAQGKRLFNKLSSVKVLSGDVYRLLSIAYCEALFDEDAAEERHMAVLRATHGVNEIMRREGSIPNDKGYFAPWAMAGDQEAS